MYFPIDIQWIKVKGSEVNQRFWMVAYEYDTYHMNSFNAFGLRYSNINSVRIIILVLYFTSHIRKCLAIDASTVKNNLFNYNFENIFDILLSEQKSFIMPPTSKKLRRHIGLGLSVRLSIRLSVTLALGQEPLDIES